MIKRKWGEKILNGEKTIEVRAIPNYEHCGERVGLCFNESGGRVFGYVTFISNIKFDKETWVQQREWIHSRRNPGPRGRQRVAQRCAFGHVHTTAVACLAAVVGVPLA